MFDEAFLFPKITPLQTFHLYGANMIRGWESRVQFLVGVFEENPDSYSG